MNALLIWSAARSIAALGVCVVIEMLMPGGARAALVLWLLRDYFRDGFVNVRQYLHAPHAVRPAIVAKAQPRVKKICRCLKQMVFLGAEPGGFFQRCDASAHA
jgi:hypothetical protein